MSQYNLPPFARRMTISDLTELRLPINLRAGLEEHLGPIARAVVATVDPCPSYEGGTFLWLLDAAGEPLGREVELEDGGRALALAYADSLLDELDDEDDELY